MADTINRGYPKPVPSHNVSEDVLLIIQALDEIDLDIGTLIQLLNGKAAVSHTHGMGDINGLANALNGKVSVGFVYDFDSIGGVSGTASAPDGYVLAKVAGSWVPQNPASLLGSHSHSISDITNLSQALSSKLDAANLATTGLKSGVVDADTFVGLDSAAQNAVKRFSWASIKSTLKTYFDGIYAAASHGHSMQAISGLADALGAKANVNALPLTKSFESGQQTITSGGSLAIPHGMAAKPKSVHLALVCLTGEAGYTVGEEVPIPSGPLMGSDRGTAIVVDDTNVNVRFGSNANAMYALHKSTGQGSTLTNANWRLVVRALA